MEKICLYFYCEKTFTTTQGRSFCSLDCLRQYKEENGFVPIKDHWKVCNTDNCAICEIFRKEEIII